MKRLLIASAALAMLGAGAAFAQQTTPAPATAAPVPAAATPPATAPTDPTTTTPVAPDPASTNGPATTPAPATSDTTATTDSAAAPATPQSTATTMPPSPTGAVVGDMAQANPPPAAGSYPVCTKKGQDRCVVASQRRVASIHRKAKTPTGA